MKHPAHVLTTVFLFWITASLQAANPQPYKSIDEHALRAPSGAERSIESLAQYLAKPANNREKARAIYRWVTDRIAYDLPSFLARKMGDNSPEGVLKSRLAVCHGYASLFQALCQSAGIESVVVTGRVKTVEFLDDPQLANHAWNAVKLDGQWQLVDPTWAAGAIMNGQYVKNFKDYYFLVPAEQLIFTHFPADPKWQLLAEPLTEKAFNDQPRVSPQLFCMGITLDSIRKTIQQKDFHEIVKASDHPGNPVTILEAPLEKELSVGKKYRFRIQGTTFQGIVAESQGRRFPFTPRKGKILEGQLIIPPGPLRIQGTVPAPGGRLTYWTILEYVGQ
jgi:transglutaminase/protease-like cytokinesis protein 3